MRKAWVQRAHERQKAGFQLCEGLARIDPKRRGFYLSLIELMMRAQEAGARVILDTGCGTGESTRRRVKPGQWVLGIDKSMARMTRGEHQEAVVPVWSTGEVPSASATSLALRSGGLLARAELSELVMVMFAQGCTVHKLDFMYPNPWPKSQHFGRRWYGHPIWPLALAVGHEVELRTNWQVYAQEFAYALGMWVPQAPRQGRCETWSVEPERALTAFERKYSQAGHALYRVVGQGGAGRTLVMGEIPGRGGL